MAYGNSVSSKKVVSMQSSTKPKKPTPNVFVKGGPAQVSAFIPKTLKYNAAGRNSERIVLERDVFNKTAFNNTVDTNFTQLDQAPPDLSFFDPNLATVEDFFSIYQNLFFQIPKFGDINSHQYLVIESTAYTGFIENQEQIDALLEEIVDLREENLQLQLDIQQLLGAKETIDQAISQNSGLAGSTLDELIQDEAAAGALQGGSTSDNLTPNNNPANTGNPPGMGLPGGTGATGPGIGGFGGGGGFSGGGGGMIFGNNTGEIEIFGGENIVGGGFGFGDPRNILTQNNY